MSRIRDKGRDREGQGRGGVDWSKRENDYKWIGRKMGWRGLETNKV